MQAKRPGTGQTLWRWRRQTTCRRRRLLPHQNHRRLEVRGLKLDPDNRVVAVYCSWLASFSTVVPCRSTDNQTPHQIVAARYSIQSIWFLIKTLTKWAYLLFHTQLAHIWLFCCFPFGFASCLIFWVHLYYLCVSFHDWSIMINACDTATDSLLYMKCYCLIRISGIYIFAGNTTGDCYPY